MSPKSNPNEPRAVFVDATICNVHRKARLDDVDLDVEEGKCPVCIHRLREGARLGLTPDQMVDFYFHGRLPEEA